MEMQNIRFHCINNISIKTHLIENQSINRRNKSRNGQWKA
jgi:hypothetical protein